ncbi:MAG: tyrosine-type recombinase/integrase, partial [Gammaproteobacteria bacterium]
QRDHAIVCMLFGTRLPVSAIRQLRWEQLDVQRRIVSVFLRNGSLRVSPLDDALLAALAALRSSLAVTAFARLDMPFCFPTAAGRSMTRQALGHVIQRRAQACGVREPVTPSAIRQAGLAHQAGRRSLSPAISPEVPERHHAGRHTA